MIREEFQLLFRCPACGNPCEAWPETLPRLYPGDDASSGEPACEIEVECETCGEIAQVVVTAHLLGWDAHLAGSPGHRVDVNHLDYADDLWLEELEPEPHPFTNYRTAIAEWRDLVEALGEDDGSSGRNRMLLVQLFSIVEAYLSDAVISLVHRDADALRAIVAWHPDLKAEKVALTSIAENPNLVRDFVVSRLRRTQFHRFEHVNGLI